MSLTPAQLVQAYISFLEGPVPPKDDFLLLFGTLVIHLGKDPQLATVDLGTGLPGPDKADAVSIAQGLASLDTTKSKIVGVGWGTYSSHSSPQPFTHSTARTYDITLDQQANLTPQVKINGQIPGGILQSPVAVSKSSAGFLFTYITDSSVFTLSFNKFAGVKFG
jgi:hypothetical protein